MKVFRIVFITLGILIGTAIVLIFILGYLFSAGTHGSIKGYQYPVSKVILEDAINTVIAENKILERPLIDTLGFKADNDDYYNKDGYITLDIIAPDTFNYIFRFYGGEEDWEKSPNQSEIFICMAWDNLGNGGSEGLGGVEWYKWGLKPKLIDYFEKNFIVKLDEKLELKHIEKD